MAEVSAEFIRINIALARLLFDRNEFVHDFLNGEFRQADRVTFQIKIHGFLETCTFGQTFDSGNVISHRKIRCALSFHARSWRMA